MIPFIDVMLVLLIIFIITVPVIKHAVNIDLPRASNEKLLDKPENVRLSVDADGTYFWNERGEDAELRATAGQACAPGAAARTAHPRRQGGALRARGLAMAARSAPGAQDRLHHRARPAMNAHPPERREAPEENPP
jgi:hypothetical protein